MPITYGQLTSKNGDYDAAYWTKIRTLYAGMSKLRKALKDEKLRESLFPKHLGEEDYVYQERVRRAWYIPYMGDLINRTVAAVSSDPLRMVEDKDGEAAAAKFGKAAGVASIDEDAFYDAFFKDCSPPGGITLSFNQLMRDQLTTALLCKRAWTLCEMPAGAPDGTLPKNRLEEEQLVANAAYACAVDPEDVFDWELDEEGELAWVLVRTLTRKRSTLEEGRDRVREVFTYYTPDEWTQFVYEYKFEDPPPPRKEPDQILGPHPHSFGRVPLRMFELPDALWAGSLLESIATEHFNRRNALSWGMYRSLFQFLAVNLAPPDGLSPITEDPDRGVNQVIGPGRVMVLGEKDKAAYVSPAAEPFKIAMEDLAVVRDEMHRVFSQMANSVDNSGAALKRSAESKQVDQSASAILYKELGRRTREHGEDVFETVAQGRGDGKRHFQGQGMDSFDEVSMDSLVAEAAQLETVAIPSPTFQARYKFELARRALPGASEEDLEAIKQELEDGIHAEAELQSAARDEQAKRVEDGVLPGEQPPTEDGAPPAKAKGPKKPPPKGGKGK